VGGCWHGHVLIGCFVFRLIDPRELLEIHTKENIFEDTESAAGIATQGDTADSNLIR